MKIYFPYYYKDFKCIADRCRHSCCVGWEIDVDDETLERYEAFDAPLRDEILSHISDRAIGLCDDGRCPFLDECGLCRIISSHGESAVSVICREHPRFYHTVRGRSEGGIGAVCEEACRIILSSDGYYDFTEVDRSIDPPEETEFNSIKHRDYLYELLYIDDIKTYREKLLEIRQKYGIPDFLSDADGWNRILSELEYLEASRVGELRIGKRNGRAENKAYLQRFLAYLIFRHVSPAENYENMRARIGFCLLLALIFENALSECYPSFEEAVDIARVISEEIEYSEDNTSSLILEIESII